jgi:predicted Zn-dependent protease
MVFGDSPREGLLRGGVYFHPELGFALRPPEGWKVQNLLDRLVMQAPADDARLTLSTAKRGNEQPAELLRKLLRRNPPDIDVSPLNSLPAASSADAGAFAAVVYLREATYVFSGAFRSEQTYRRYLEVARAAARSFHAISDAERATAKPLTIRLITATAGTRFAALAKTSPLGKNAESQLRLMNNLYPAGEPAPGQLIKVIE